MEDIGHEEGAENVNRAGNPLERLRPEVEWTLVGVSYSVQQEILRHIDPPVQPGRQPLVHRLDLALHELTR